MEELEKLLQAVNDSVNLDILMAMDTEILLCTLCAVLDMYEVAHPGFSTTDGIIKMLAYAINVHNKK